MFENNADQNTLPDVQSETDTRQVRIQKVGVTNIRHPFSFQSSGREQATIGNWQMFVSLEAEKRGTHMSRFLEILSGLEGPQSLDSLSQVCGLIVDRLNANDAYLSVEFPWFVEKPAPVTGKTGKLDIDVRLEISRGRKSDCVLVIRVPATSLCPCSKSISRFGAHNQRCELTIEVRFAGGETVSLDELVSIAESSASAPVYSVIKRDDEKWVTEQAYENPKFVEDTVRELAHRLQQDARISWFRCASENFESIHSHNAYATIESGPSD
ncbi:MAG: GTP cyclohydrolase FolE2 [Planctomycetota bacterium]